MVLTQTSLQELVTKQVVTRGSKDVIVDTTSIALHLDNQFTKYAPYNGEPFTPPRKMETTTTTLGEEGSIILPPNGKLLACTQEVVSIPKDNFGLVQTKGSIARGFLFAHVCDGQIDPGYKGKITLELVNMSEFYYKLIPGMPVASLYLFQTDKSIDSYQGRYQNSMSPTAMI
ncbi:dCTP deaminase [Pseudoalteromonas sp. 68 DY56-GL68]|uniref:dCTP deaminase n=1 Tax=Pseudoalteromonas sp. 68 DY56-GL68 TaxID=2974919 RepID=UPI00352BBCC1